MIAQAYRTVMDPSENPLRKLPKMVRFQYMSILAYMWSAIFAVWLGHMWLFGASVVAHALLLVGLFFTAEIFAFAKSGEPVRAASRSWRVFGVATRKTVS